MTKDDFLMASKDMNPITGWLTRDGNVTVEIVSLVSLPKIITCS